MVMGGMPRIVYLETLGSDESLQEQQGSQLKPLVPLHRAYCTVVNSMSTHEMNPPPLKGARATTPKCSN